MRPFRHVEEEKFQTRRKVQKRILKLKRLQIDFIYLDKKLKKVLIFFYFDINHKNR